MSDRLLRVSDRFESNDSQVTQTKDTEFSETMLQSKTTQGFPDLKTCLINREDRSNCERGVPSSTTFQGVTP
ncbi:hypothetical protein RclHR1_04270011 [Rhizophagus clarus]|uniref:Uncharacterized protein n=1 Tax=Rhizophagus clarus TaxID=94130 RepID=A0A2Z6RKR8_9GLOM|nr:hypothetical protein RclHR1_04270011 [Rhizophagus clarus]